VRFIGSTCGAISTPSPARKKTSPKQLQARNKAFRAANYYLSKNTTFRKGEPVLAEAQREMSLACQDWLRAALATPSTGRRWP
jgi:Ni/Co efflux regulator RcnB